MMKTVEWTELAQAACDDAGLGTGSIDTIATWDQQYCANAVYRVDGERYLKIYGPGAAWQFQVERSVLRTIEAYREIPAPRIITVGELTQGWPYIVMTEVAGATAEEIWDSLPRSEQLALAGEIGRITAAIHRLPQEKLAAVEQAFGGMREHTTRYRDQHIAAIEATESISVKQRDDLIHFIQVEAWEHLNGTPVLAHFDLAHNHIYLTRERGRVRVTGIIDWGEAMLGPAEWDIAYLWFWTFSGDRQAMRECFRTLYADSHPPERFARRCLASLFHTSSMSLLWPGFAERKPETDAIVRELTAYLFPPDLFGLPD